MKFVFNIMVFLVCWVCYNLQVELILNIVNVLYMEFVYIFLGLFWMGSVVKERGYEVDELYYQVEISNGFYIQIIEVMCKQWKVLMEGDLFSFFVCGDSCLVDCFKLVWVDKFIEKFNVRDGIYLYWLFIEVEWEYVVKVGFNIVFFIGLCLGESNVVYDVLMLFGFCRQGVKY